MPYTILVTGANRGLGLALCRNLLEQGHTVFALSRRPGEDLIRLQTRFPATLHCHPADVTDENSVRQAITTIAGQTDHLDILINNAAVHLDQDAPFIESVDFAVYLPTFQVNAIAPLMLVKHSLPLLRRGEKKLIANISSEAGSITNAWRTAEYAYCMSKSALNMACKILQNALTPEGIKVLAIHPGWFSSDMGGEHAPISPEQAAKTVSQVLLRPLALNGAIFVSETGEEMDW